MKKFKRGVIDIPSVIQLMNNNTKQRGIDL